MHTQRKVSVRFPPSKYLHTSPKSFKSSSISPIYQIFRFIESFIMHTARLSVSDWVFFSHRTLRSFTQPSAQKHIANWFHALFHGKTIFLTFAYNHVHITVYFRCFCTGTPVENETVLRLSWGYVVFVVVFKNWKRYFSYMRSG